MQHDRSPAPKADPVEQAVLSLLVSSGRRVWAFDELAREIGDRLATIDAVRRLRAEGIVHRVGDEFIIVSRTAERTIDLWQ